MLRGYRQDPAEPEFTLKCGVCNLERTVSEKEFWAKAGALAGWYTAFLKAPCALCASADAAAAAADAAAKFFT